MTSALETPVHDAVRGRIAAAFGSLAAAIAASSCCLLPVVLFTLGVGGAWIGTLVRLAPLQPYFIAAAAVALGIGYWLVYRARAACPNRTCGRPIADRLVTSVLAVATILVVLAVGLNFIAPLVAS